MKTHKNIILGIFMLANIIVFFAGCDIDEPFPEPSGDFGVWILNVETNEEIQISEPLNIEVGTIYDYLAEGSGQQFVFWFGEPGDPESPNPKGSDFEDRGKNNLSKGAVAKDGVTKHGYDAPGEYEIVMVASSFSYSENKYTEHLTRKSITVVEPE